LSSFLSSVMSSFVAPPASEMALAPKFEMLRRLQNHERSLRRHLLS
jgi:hypothetical protein